MMYERKSYLLILCKNEKLSSILFLSSKKFLNFNHWIYNILPKVMWKETKSAIYIKIPQQKTNEEEKQNNESLTMTKSNHFML